MDWVTKWVTTAGPCGVRRRWQSRCYVHGFELHLEAVRQIRGTSTDPVPSCQVSMVTAGPMVAPTSDVLYGSWDALQ